MFSNKSILITGGTGSFGRAFVSYVLKKWPDVKRLVVYSRDEQKQFQMDQEFSTEKYPQMRYFIGDVRDLDRLKRAMNGIDFVVHAAAMKHVHIAEYNPDECVKTNVGGAENVIKACLDCGVKSVVALSTDKACAPINLYGATKLTSDKLFIAANNITGWNPIKFSVVRYGNVFGSNGSVVPFFLKKRNEGHLPITNANMTRFNITLNQGVEMVIAAFENSWGGELYVPKLASYHILDIAKAIAPNIDIIDIGIRPGEKIHEEMITTSDSFYTYDHGEFYTILPSKPKWNLKDYIAKFNPEKVPLGFNYNSGDNTDWITLEDIVKLIKEYVDPNFKPL